MRRYPKKVLNTIYILLLMIVLILLLAIQSTKDFIVSIFKKSKQKNSGNKHSTKRSKNQLANQNNP